MDRSCLNCENQPEWTNWMPIVRGPLGERTDTRFGVCGKGVNVYYARGEQPYKNSCKMWRLENE